MHGLPVHQDLAFVGVIEAVEDAHQRGLARAVFAQQGVNFARGQGKIDVVVGHQGAKALGDPVHLLRRAWVSWLAVYRSLSIESRFSLSGLRVTAPAGVPVRPSGGGCWAAVATSAAMATILPEVRTLLPNRDHQG